MFFSLFQGQERRACRTLSLFSTSCTSPCWQQGKLALLKCSVFRKEHKGTTRVPNTRPRASNTNPGAANTNPGVPRIPNTNPGAPRTPNTTQGQLELLPRAVPAQPGHRQLRMLLLLGESSAPGMCQAAVSAEQMLTPFGQSSPEPRSFSVLSAHPPLRSP